MQSPSPKQKCVTFFKSYTFLLGIPFFIILMVMLFLGYYVEPKPIEPLKYTTYTVVFNDGETTQLQLYEPELTPEGYLLTWTIAKVNKHDALVKIAIAADVKEFFPKYATP